METPSQIPLVPDASGGLDWAGRGTSHVDFSPEEELPLSQGRFLGHGVNGGVFETTVGGVKVAWKRQFCRQRIAERELREIAILKKLEGQHIIKLVGTYTQGPFLGLLLSPVAVCDLGTFLEDVDSLLHRQGDAEVDWQAISRRLDGLGIDSSIDPTRINRTAQMRIKQSIGCISSAIAYLHQQAVRHKDIKPSNILLSAAPGLWVTDFGSSTDFSDISQSVTNGGERGTPKYFAPEVARYESSGRSADIFSLACVFLEMIGLCNRYSLEQLKSLRLDKDRSFHANLESMLHWFNFSGTEAESVVDAQLMALVREMLAPGPQERPAARDIEKRLHLIDVFRRPVDDPLWGECCTPTPESSRQDQHSQVAEVSIRLGNQHQMEGRRHHWLFYIEAPAAEPYFSEVHCFLHASFQHPYSVKQQAPFHWGGSGWGYFTISVIIELKAGFSWIFPDAKIGPSGRSFLPLHWDLNFEQAHTHHDFRVGLAAL